MNCGRNCFVNIFFLSFFIHLHVNCIVEIEAAYKDEIHAQHFNADSKGKFIFCVGWVCWIFYVFCDERDVKVHTSDNNVNDQLPRHQSLRKYIVVWQSRYLVDFHLIDVLNQIILSSRLC